jgi:hypothetical protein
VPKVQWKTPDDGQRNCPKHVELLEKNKFGKLVRLLVLLKRTALRTSHLVSDSVAIIIIITHGFGVGL